MADKKVIKPVALAVGAALAGSFAISGAVNAADTGAANPFQITSLSVGYMLGEGEGKCGGDKEGEGKCGEGSCGADKKGEGKCGEGKCGDKEGEGKCGEGSCGADKKGEGSCGGDKDSEGSCGGHKDGEGSCGGDDQS